MTVYPIVILGDQQTSSGADDVTQGFRKYNLHEHAPVRLPNFLVYDVAIGDPVYLYDVNDRVIFDSVSPPVITYLSETLLQISVTANTTLSSVKLFIKAPKEEPQDAIVIEGVDIVKGTDLISFSAGFLEKGFITQAQLQALSRQQLNYFFSIPTTFSGQSYYMMLPTAHKVWVKALNLITQEGTGTFQLISVINNVESNLGEPLMVEATNEVFRREFTSETVDSEAAEYPANQLSQALSVGSAVKLKVVSTASILETMLVTVTLDIERVLV